MVSSNHSNTPCLGFTVHVLPTSCKNELRVLIKMLPNHYNKNQALRYCAPTTTSRSDRYNDATVLCANSTLHLHDSYWLRICNGRERHSHGESSCMNHKLIALHDACSGLQISCIKGGQLSYKETLQKWKYVQVP